MSDQPDTATVSRQALGELVALAQATLPRLVAARPSSQRAFALATALTEAEQAIRHASGPVAD